MRRRHQVLMLGVRWGGRALPVAWRVVETDGAIGFAVQQDLLDAVRGWLPAEARATLHGDLALSGAHCFQDVALTGKRVGASIGTIHDAGHAEPCEIAERFARDRRHVRRAFCKSRGFSIQDTQIQHPDRFGRLILVTSLALCWAVSTGMRDAAEKVMLTLLRGALQVFARGAFHAQDPPTLLAGVPAADC